MKLRVGLVGLGPAWESRHRSALRSLNDRLEVRAVCEPVAHRAEQVAAEFGAVATDGFRVLANREDIDAILQLSGQWYGTLPILAACDAGKAVYCTSVMDFDPAQAERVKQRVEESGIAFFAEFALRQAPATLRLKELIATQLGQPRLLFCHRRQTANEPNGEANDPTTRELVEAVDWCRYLVGEEVRAVTGITQMAAEAGSPHSYRMMSLDFSDPDRPGTGPLAQVSCGRYIPATWREAATFRPPAALQVSCERGIAFVDLPSTLIWFDSAGRHMESLDSERPMGEQLLLSFCRSATSLMRNTLSLEDAYRAQLIVAQAETSFAEGRRIDLTY